MSDALDDITDVGAIKVELRHVQRHQDVQDERLDRHGERLTALEALANKARGAWWAIGLAAGVFAFVGSFFANWILKGG